MGEGCTPLIRNFVPFQLTFFCLLSVNMILSLLCENDHLVNLKHRLGSFPTSSSWEYIVVGAGTLIIINIMFNQQKILGLMGTILVKGGGEEWYLQEALYL